MGLINRAKVKRTALDLAPALRAHPFSRVSDGFLDEIEAFVLAEIKRKIKRAPSKGATLQPEHLP
jgi:hypothetical protein